MSMGERLLARAVALTASCVLAAGLVTVEGSPDGLPGAGRARLLADGLLGGADDGRVRQTGGPCTSCAGVSAAAPAALAAPAAPGSPAVPTPSPSSSAPAEGEPPGSSTVLVERFAGQDGTFARERDFWGQDNGGVDENRTWFATSGSMQRRAGAGRSDAAVFRMWTRRTDLAFPRVELDVRFDGWSGGTEPWNGINLWLNRRLCVPQPDCAKVADGEDSGYALDFLNRDGSLTILKKVPGPTEDGTYHQLAATTWQPTPGRTYRFAGQVVREGDGTARLQVRVDGQVLVEAVDDGSIGGPILTGGRVGLRGDNADFTVDDLVVTRGA